MKLGDGIAQSVYRLGYKLDDQVTEVGFRARARNVSLLHSVKTGSRSIQRVTGIVSLRVKRPGSEHYLTSSFRHSEVSVETYLHSPTCLYASVLKSAGTTLSCNTYGIKINDTTVTPVDNSTESLIICYLSKITRS
jgi:hypothetical protein